MNYSWAADMVNHQQSSNKENVGVNKYNDEKLTALVNTLIPIEDESDSVTPQAPIVQGRESAVPNKELYKMIEAYLHSKGGTPNTPSFEPCVEDESGCRTNTKIEDTVNSDGTNSELSTEELKSSKSGAESPSTLHVTKFQRVGDQGRIVSGYYTPAVEEKLEGFEATYINIGNPRILKEVVGVRKNSTFIPTGKKKLNSEKPVGVIPHYLVVSFENRKKANSPYVEYPLAKLGAIIKALEDLKNRAIQKGYYSDVKILKCEYPEDTIITDKNCKDTVLPSMNTTV